MPVVIDNPVQNLELRIKNGDRAVNAADVSKAFDDEKAHVEKLYKELGYGPTDYVCTEHLARLEAFKAQVLKEVTNLDDAYKNGRLKVFDESRKMRAQLDPRVMAIQARHATYEKSRADMEVVTNPDRQNALFDDWEGFGMPWQKGMEDENYNNKTRWATTGYFAALQMNDPAQANAEIAKAKGIYDESRFNKNSGDKTFNYDHLMKDMGLESYFNDLQKYGFANETNGFLAGYLKLGDGYLGTNKDAYRQALFGQLDKMKSDGLLTYTPAPNEPENVRDYKKAQFELGVLESLRSPREWVENLNALRGSFERLKADAAILTSSLGFSFVDGRVNTLLAKPSDQITYADETEMGYVEKRMGEEAYVAMLRRNGDVVKEQGNAVTKFGAIDARNKTLNKIPAAQIANVQTMLTDSAKLLQGVTLAHNTGLDGLIEQNGYLTNARQKITAAVAELTRMEAELNKPEPAPAPAPRPTPTPVPAPGPGKGAKGGEKPGSVESKEDAELQAFLREKNLVEKVSGQDEKGGGSYAYFLNDGNFKVKANDRGTPVLNFGNKEVNDIFVSKSNRLMDSLFGDLIDGKAKKDLEAIIRNGGASDTKKAVQAAKYVLDKFHGRLEGDGDKRMKALERAWGKAEFINMQFANKPSLATLKSTYENKYLEEWRTVGKEMDSALDTPLRKPESDLPDKSEVKIGPELDFLRPVYKGYAEALTLLAKYDGHQERYPEGVTFNLKLNNKDFNCRFQKNGDVYTLNYAGGSWDFKNIKELMTRLNSGEVHQQLNELVLLGDDWYKRYEGITGELDKHKRGDLPHHFNLEFSWGGALESDPQIDTVVGPHGIIKYTVDRKNIGSHGEEKYTGFADNFNDFMIQIGHLKKWAEGPEHKKTEENAETRQDILFRAISNPMTYRNEDAEKAMGRVVSFQMMDNESVRVCLDWGGGNDPNNKNNVMLKVLANGKGGVNFNLTGHGIGEDGKGITTEAVADFADVRARVKQERAKALGNEVARS